MKFQDDGYYIEKVIHGDASAFASLVAKHKNLVFSIALKILNNREDAEEVAQDVFLKAYQSLNTFEMKSKFSTWLYRIAYNTSISKTRKKKPEYVTMNNYIITNFTTDEIVAGVDRMDDNEQIRMVEHVLRTLPEEDSLLITLFYKAEHSIDDISTITGLSVSNVKVRLHRIRKRMYDEMNELMKKN
jgi:RNA polymerase sigma factor (sigma-70 family)